MDDQAFDKTDIYPNLDIEHLDGTNLPGGWRVVTRISNSERTLHSVGYIVEDAQGRRGFLKVLDFTYYFITADPAEALNAATQAFLDERRMLQVAKQNGFGHVVRIYTSGVLKRANGGPLQYLVSELADSDARRQMDMGSRADDAWSLRITHHAATGLRELHSVKITHQDVQPGNVFCFRDEVAKLGDLGRAVDPYTKALHLEHEIAGDEAFAPPELLYRHLDPDFTVRRIGCDVYLLGSLIVSLLTGVAMTPLIQAQLPDDHKAANWRGLRYQDVLPSIRHGFAKVLIGLDKSLANRIPGEQVRSAIIGIVHQLCEPDPVLRGDPIARARGENPYSLERYISRLDRLSHELAIIRRRKISA